MLKSRFAIWSIALAIVLVVSLMPEAQAQCFHHGYTAGLRTAPPQIFYAPDRERHNRRSHIKQRNRSYGPSSNLYAPEYTSRFSPVNPSINSGTSNYLHELGEGLAVWPEIRPLRVFIASGSGVYGYRSSFENLMAESFNEWTRVSGGKLSFQRVQDAGRADIIVSWVTKLNSDRHSSEVGKTYTITAKHPLLSVGVLQKAHVNILTHSNGRPFSDTELRNVALHEIGHAIGLQGHSSDPRDIMYHTTSRHQSGALSSRDINTLNSLYGSRLTAFR